jgi:hypothetical protein
MHLSFFQSAEPRRSIEIPESAASLRNIRLPRFTWQVQNTPVTEMIRWLTDWAS